MLKIIALKCPLCNADISVIEGKKQFYCQYCGTKLMLNNENEYIYRQIDEASIKRDEIKKIVQLKQIEMEDKRQEREETRRKYKIIISLVLAITGILMIIIGSMSDNSSGELKLVLFTIEVIGWMILFFLSFIWILDKLISERNSSDGRIKVPYLVGEYENKNYKVIKEALEDAGFKNVKCIALNDLTFGLLKKPEIVESITINGEEISVYGRGYQPTDSVIISYHSYINR